MSERKSTLSSGPWPFTTRQVTTEGIHHQLTRCSRHHRKGLSFIQDVEGRLDEAAYPGLLFSSGKIFGTQGLFAAHSLNWWIGSIFALGSSFFALASTLSLLPNWAAKLGFSIFEVNALFFIGSLPFTCAAYLQLFQAANAGSFTEPPRPDSSRKLIFGFRPQDIGWLSSALQFVGTLLFNFNTFDALLPGLTWFEADLIIWIPNILGSILFLSSGYLAFIETCHAHFAFQPQRAEWRMVFINLMGCVGFMMAAIFSVFSPGPANAQSEFLALAFTLQGALCFLVGSLLMLPEAAQKT